MFGRKNRKSLNIMMIISSILIVLVQGGIGNTINVHAAEATSLDIEIGSIVSFGSYEQDGNLENGTEPIEWIVLDKQDDKVLLLSEKILDRRNYFGANYPVTWENSHLRFWLNAVFYESAFNEEEQQRIQQTEVVNEDKFQWKTDGGSNTEDYIFLLSISEAESYIPNEVDRIAAVTTYANRNADDSQRDYADWWLRSPGNYSYHAAYVFNYGGVNANGYGVKRDDLGVRPALWVTLD